MCGICGILGPAERGAVERMTSGLAHRGPDGFGVRMFDANRGGLGHRRLSILDLSASGSQPMTDTDGRYWITYNGEVYNFQELRRELETRGCQFRSDTDTEVLLYAYREWGPGFLDKLIGMFAFAIWDEHEGKLFAARDRLGIKPFYYFSDSRHFLFASEIKALFNSGIIKPEIDHKALHTPAMYQVAPHTGFKDVYKLLPGHYLTVDANDIGNPRIQRYWSITPRCDVNDMGAAMETLDSLLLDSIQRHMISDVPIGVLLSGGLDSSLLVALMSKHTTSPINSFTITFTKDDQKHERMADDSRYARDVAAMFNCNHREIEIRPDVVDLLPKMMWHLDEPLADPAAINTFLISRAAREHGIPVLLNGAGADEVFGGYRKYLACLIADQYQMVTPEPARRLLNTAVGWLPTATSGRGLRTIRWGKRFLSFAGLPQDERFLSSFSVPPHEFDQLFVKTSANGVRFQETYFATAQRDFVGRTDLPYLVRMCLADTSVYLPDHNLLYGDKCSMAAGVETRPPFTDHRIVEFMFTTGDKLRIDRFQQKVLLKKVAERYLPRNIIYRPKAPFGAPLRAWIRGPLSEMIGDYLSPGALKKRGIYNADYVWTKIQNDSGGREDNAHLIWTLLCNEVWIRTFFDKPL